MIGVNNFNGQYRNVIPRRSLPYRQAVDCWQTLPKPPGGYTCDVSVVPVGKVYDFGDDGQRKQFCNDNGVRGKKEIFVLAITHNATGKPSPET